MKIDKISLPKSPVETSNSIYTDLIVYPKFLTFCINISSPKYVCIYTLYIFLILDYCLSFYIKEYPNSSDFNKIGTYLFIHRIQGETALLSSDAWTPISLLLHYQHMTFILCSNKTVSTSTFKSAFQSKGEHKWKEEHSSFLQRT